MASWDSEYHVALNIPPGMQDLSRCWWCGHTIVDGPKAHGYIPLIKKEKTTSEMPFERQVTKTATKTTIAVPRCNTCRVYHRYSAASREKRLRWVARNREVPQDAPQWFLYLRGTLFLSLLVLLPAVMLLLAWCFAPSACWRQGWFVATLVLTSILVHPIIAFFLARMVARRWRARYPELLKAEQRISEILVEAGRSLAEGREHPEYGEQYPLLRYLSGEGFKMDWSRFEQDARLESPRERWRRIFARRVPQQEQDAAEGRQAEGPKAWVRP